MKTFPSMTVNCRYFNIVYTSLAMLILACLVSDSFTPSKSPLIEDLSRRVSYRRDHSI